MMIKEDKRIVLTLTETEYCDINNALINLKKQPDMGWPEALQELQDTLALVLASAACVKR